MKRLIHILSFLLLLLPATALHAKAPRAYLLGGGHTNMSGHKWVTDKNGLRSGTFGYVHNLFGIYLDGSYSAMFTSMPNTDFRPGGAAMGGGICYEHQRGMFKFHTGLGIRYQAVSNNVGDTTILDPSVKDKWGYPYTLRYDFRERVDDARSLHAQLPVMLGLGLREWYFLAGVKVNYTFYGSTQVKMLGTTTGTYDQFIGIFEEMDNHGFRKDVAIQRTGDKLDLKIDALVAFETGYEWHHDIPNAGTRYSLQFLKPGERMEYRIRISAFAEYGLVNICPKTDNNFVYIPKDYKWDFAKYQASHVFSTTLAQPYNVHNFYVGIKITAMIGSYLYKRCALCQDFISESNMNTIGDRGNVKK